MERIKFEGGFVLSKNEIHELGRFEVGETFWTDRIEFVGNWYFINNIDGDYAHVLSVPVNETECVNLVLDYIYSDYFDVLYDNIHHGEPVFEGPDVDFDDPKTAKFTALQRQAILDVAARKLKALVESKGYKV